LNSCGKSGFIFLARILKFQWHESLTFTMHKLDVVSRWNFVKGILRQRYGTLTDADLTFNHGKEGELIGRLQKKLGKSRAELMRIIGDC
jgi:uncharacterized protein YjbJ (UPF0337 family)